MRLSRTADDLAAALRAGRRRKVTVERLRQVLFDLEPQTRYGVQRRRRLREIIDELAQAGSIALPRGRNQYERTERPELPRFVLVEGIPAPASRKAPGAQTHPWLPELRWAATLTPPLRVDEMEVLRRVSAFLSAGRGQALPVVPAQERSLQIFGDEKRLGELALQRLFAPGRLSLDLLACREVHPPFVHARITGLPNMLAVENSATYDTLRRLLDASGPVGVLAYGAGKHFILSVAAAEELDPVPTRILYFGDVDPDGLSIPVKASRTAVERGLPPVEPAGALYELLFAAVEAGPGTEPAVADGVHVSDPRVLWLPESLRRPAANLLTHSQRVAQERVGLELLMRDRHWRDKLRRQFGAPALPPALADTGTGTREA